MRKVARYGPFGGWILLIIFLSVVPTRNLTAGGLLGTPNMDKIFHGTVYLIMAILGMRTTALGENRNLSRDMIVVVIICVGLGVLLEFTQAGLTRTRHFEVFDIIANIIGTLAGCLVFNAFFKRRYYGN